MKTYWSIQTKAAWEQALAFGYLQGSPKHICIEER